MSGLVNGLQNRLRRFESARHLREARRKQGLSPAFFMFYILCSLPVLPLLFRHIYDIELELVAPQIFQSVDNAVFRGVLLFQSLVFLFGLLSC